MNKKLIDRIVWWIPIKRLRDDIRKLLYYLVDLKVESIREKNMISNDIKAIECNIVVFAHYFNMLHYMIDNPKEFLSNIEEFKKNLDDESLDVLKHYLIQIKSLANSKICFERAYVIPNTTNFFSDEQKIVWASRHNIYNYFINRYQKYDINDLHFSLHVFYYEAGIVYLPNKVKERFKDSVAIDCGAWFGDTAIMFLEEYNFNLIHAFEPVKSTYNKLNETIKKYNLSKNIIPHNYAVSNKTDTCYMTSYNDKGGSAIVDFDNNETEKIQTIKLDDYLKYYSDDNISLIKLDVEGFEEQALIGAVDIIKKYRPVLLIGCYHDHTALGQMFRIKRFIESLNLSYKILYRALSPDTIFEHTLICYVESFNGGGGGDKCPCFL